MSRNKKPLVIENPQDDFVENIEWLNHTLDLY